jgi:cell wall-associated NlpC family hydrolase
LFGVGSQSTRNLRSSAIRKKVARRVVVPVSKLAIAFAREQLGRPYLWGAEGPNAFDCSGLTQRAYRAAGISLPRTARAQATVGHRIAPSMGVGALRPGDLVFWAYDPHDLSTVHHVAIYLGGGKVIQSPQAGEVVKISPIWMSGYAGATRPG